MRLIGVTSVIGTLALSGCMDSEIRWSRVDGGIPEASAASRGAPQVGEDRTPPAFAGVLTAQAVSPTEIELTWRSAVDEATPAPEIIYDVYLSMAPGAFRQPSPHSSSKAGEISRRITGLTAGATYYVVVRARDKRGNRDSNITEIKVQLPGGFDFEIAPAKGAPQHLIVPRGSKVAASFDLSAAGNGAPEEVELSVSGLPAGMTAAISPSPVALPGQATVILSAEGKGALSTGTTVTVTGRSTKSGVKKAASLTLDVVAQTPADVDRYTWYLGGSGTSCKEVCEDYGESCLQGGLNAHSRDTTCTAAQAFGANGCEKCAAGDTACAALTLSEDEKGNATAYYFMKGSLDCADPAPADTRPICPCKAR